MADKIFLGIDLGTQGLSVVACDDQLTVLATAEGGYEMVPDQPAGHFLQDPASWINALTDAMNDLHQKLSLNGKVKAIGISGQMHGEVLLDKDGEVLTAARLWCDSRNEEEEKELTGHVGVKMPKRMTSSRWLWTRRNLPDIAQKVDRMTTPSGYLAYRLTGQWNLGIGDASGMFPIDIQTNDYCSESLSKYGEVSKEIQAKPLNEILPAVRVAGEDGGSLSEGGAQILKLESGIPVAPAEGDQPAALAGSLISKPGMVSLSFGTSVCANSVGEKAFEGVSPAVDHFCSVDGRPINMIWLRNGTTFMNQVVELFGSAANWDRKDSFANLMPKVLDAPLDCEGLLAIPFLEDEPGLEVSAGSQGGIVGLGSKSVDAGSAIRAAFLATVFNLRIGTEILDAQSFGRTKLILTGGLTKTPGLAQLIADVFQNEVEIPEAGEEGTAWGAAVLAKFRSESLEGSDRSWDAFLEELPNSSSHTFLPNPESCPTYQEMLSRYKSLIEPCRVRL